MILFIENAINGDRKYYRVGKLEDLREVFSRYPMTYDIALSYNTLKEAVEAVAEYLNSHHMDAWIEGDLSKSIRNKAIALGVALSTMAAPQLGSPLSFKDKIDSGHPIQAPKPGNHLGSRPEDEFLWNIMQIESSGGKNVNHPQAKVGVNKGQVAVGRWGLMPNTINEMINRMRASGKLTPKMAALENMSSSDLKQHFAKDPHSELEMARFIARYVLSRNKGNHYKAAYAWNTGHNLPYSKITDDHLANSSYVTKYKAAHSQNPLASKKPESPDPKVTMNKAESETDFKERFGQWMKNREEMARQPRPRTSDFVPDPGRIREAELDERKPTSLMNEMEKIKENVNRANGRNS